MDRKYNVQIDYDHYHTEGYVDLYRFISYYYQIDLVRSLNPENVLEIGIGNSVVNNYIKEIGINVETCDFEDRLNPDYVADIRDLSVIQKQYDLILACQILEHIPWDDVDKALSELHRLSSKNVIISLPLSSIVFDIIFRFPGFGFLFNKLYFNFNLRIPRFYYELKFEGQHYWEIGTKGYHMKKIRTALKKYFVIKKEVRPWLNSYHHFFVLEKK